MVRTDPGNARIGYARVSSQDQDLGRQIDELRKAGCIHIYREKVSGASRNKRKELRKLLRALEPGDTVIVTNIDRLARSVFDLFAIVKDIDDKGAHFVCLGQKDIDTTTAMGRMLLAVLAAVADMERDLIRTRTAEGRERAQRRGVKFGRKPKLTQAQRLEALDRKAAGERLTDIARSYNVHFATISRLTP